MISRFKKTHVMLAAGLFLMLAAVFFLNNTKSVNDNPYDLGSPVKIILYFGGKSVEITPEDDFFYSIIDAMKEDCSNVTWMRVADQISLLGSS